MNLQSQQAKLLLVIVLLSFGIVAIGSNIVLENNKPSSSNYNLPLQGYNIIYGHARTADCNPGPCADPSSIAQVINI